MFGFRYIKTLPTSYLIQYRNGSIRREGQGLSFFYFAPTSSLVSIPVASRDEPFMFQETTHDYQEVTLQGRVTWRVKDAPRLASMMNFTLDASGTKYVSDDPEKLPARVLQQVQVAMRAQLNALELQVALASSAQLVETVQKSLSHNRELEALGLELLGLSVLAIKPKPETGKALEARVRESILREADEAAYARRNAAVEQERTIKENELNTEVAIEKKKREVQEERIEAERIFKQKKNAIAEEDLAAQVDREEKRKALVAKAAENTRAEADAKAYHLAAMLNTVKGVDVKTLEALALNGMDASRMVALGFRGLAEGASKIGQLNVSPDLLRELITSEAKA
ncbi:SPFH domain-containing protein [Permianibacter sp. IMCC34836]|uniref:SPFH domain-containing protein n=1 Tax=Permianibacter fluminis TaxID=2738515 RepID=UPI001552EEE4|nr:SPFH domain-containing protein [Permianibacter fluminis]NQD35982.1 SPFH domain-containing protein [Permianibacter fluminis]